MVFCFVYDLRSLPNTGCWHRSTQAAIRRSRARRRCPFVAVTRPPRTRVDQTRRGPISKIAIKTTTAFTFFFQFFFLRKFSTTPPRPFFSTLACRCTSSRVVPKLTGLSGCVSPVSFGAGVLGRPRRDAVSAADLFRARWRVVAFYLLPAWPLGWRSAPV